MAEDITLECRDCHQPFIFEAGEQDFFTQNGYPAPIRCKSCRQKKKAQREKRGATH